MLSVALNLGNVEIICFYQWTDDVAVAQDDVCDDDDEMYTTHCYGGTIVTRKARFFGGLSGTTGHVEGLQGTQGASPQPVLSLELIKRYQLIKR